MIYKADTISSFLSRIAESRKASAILNGKQRTIKHTDKSAHDQIEQLRAKAKDYVEKVEKL